MSEGPAVPSIVVIDDERIFTGTSFEGAVYARTEDEALALLSRAWTRQQVAYADPIAELWLDHDLGDGGSIATIVDYLSALAGPGCPVALRSVLVHSQNPTGADMVVRTLRPYYDVTRTPLPPCDIQVV